MPLPRWYLWLAFNENPKFCPQNLVLSPSSLFLPMLVKLVLDVVLHGVRLVVDELPGVAGDVVFEHVLAVHGLQLHSGGQLPN